MIRGNYKLKARVIEDGGKCLAHLSAFMCAVPVRTWYDHFLRREAQHSNLNLNYNIKHKACYENIIFTDNLINFCKWMFSLFTVYTLEKEKARSGGIWVKWEIETYKSKRLIVGGGRNGIYFVWLH